MKGKNCDLKALTNIASSFSFCRLFLDFVNVFYFLGGKFSFDSNPSKIGALSDRIHDIFSNVMFS